MISILRKFTIGFLTATIVVTASTASARSDVSCDVSTAAGKPAPSQQSIGKNGRFNIFWQISTQIEELADAADNRAAMADIREASQIADGYFVNALLAGAVIYWPTRPRECALNFKRIAEGDSIEVEGQTFTFDKGGAGGREACAEKQTEFLQSRSFEQDAARDVQSGALQRVFSNLDLAGEQRRGKAVWGASIIRSTDFSYDKETDKVSLIDLPNTYCVLNANGITPNGLFIYQEPKIQTTQDKFLWIPRTNRRGEKVFTKPRLDKIPENTHAFGLIAESFQQASVPVSGFRANIRRWNSNRSPQMAKELMAIPRFGGFNFEGGSGMMFEGKNSPVFLVEGVSWVLANTDRDVSFLMPGYWPRDMVGNEVEVDTVLDRLRQFVNVVNTGINAKMKLPEGQNAICTNRVTFIVGSYGRPMHVKPLPMRRDSGKLAGTVTGQIKALADIRSELCGS